MVRRWIFPGMTFDQSSRIIKGRADFGWTLGIDIACARQQRGNSQHCG